MRGFFLLILLVLGTAAPAAAQSIGGQNIERRVGRLEQEMRAVQRRVFPGGAGATIDPELQPVLPTPQQGGASGDAVSSLASRIEAVEAQLARVTGQVEETDWDAGLRDLDKDLDGTLDDDSSGPGEQPPA